MGRLLFFVPGEKKGARPFPLFLRAGKRVIWGAPLPGRKKAPCALPFAPCGGQGCGLLAGAPTALWKKTPLTGRDLRPQKRAPRSAPLRAVFLRLKAPFFKGHGRAGRRGGGEGRCHIRAAPWDKMWGRGDCDGQCQSRAFLPRAVDAGQCRNGRGARQTAGAAGRALPQP